jgi:hypothetical protein
MTKHSQHEICNHLCVSLYPALSQKIRAFREVFDISFINKQTAKYEKKLLPHPLISEVIRNSKFSEIPLKDEGKVHSLLSLEQNCHNILQVDLCMSSCSY